MKLSLFTTLTILAVAILSTQSTATATAKKGNNNSSSPSSKSRKPSRSSSSKSRKPKRSSTSYSSKSRKPSRRSYTSTSKSRKPSNRCVPDNSPRPRNSNLGRFRFNLVRSNAQCVDRDGELYEYGQINHINDFSECADACVNDVSTRLVDSGSFRGIDYDCKRRECRCLYDEGTLSNRNSQDFDRTNRREYGYGPIDGGKSSRDMYCGKLAGTTAVNDFLDSDAVTELWGMEED